MFSKKTRNLTVAVLALVMALTLSFGLFGFNTQANAAGDHFINLSDTSATASPYEWSFGELKCKNYSTVYVEVPFLGNGTIAWKCKSANSGRFLYLKHNVNGSWEKDTSRSIVMAKSYHEVSFTSDDVYESAGKYYLGFTTTDDFKGIGVLLNITPSAKTFTVDFDTNDGKEGTFAQMSYTEGNAGITLPTPTREKYTFTGWYNGTTKVETPYAPTDNVKLIAQWNYNYVNVTVDHVPVEVLKGTNGYKLTLPDAAAHEGETFLGWSYADDNTPVITPEVASVDVGEQDITLYTCWEVQAGLLLYHDIDGNSHSEQLANSPTIADYTTLFGAVESIYTFEKWVDENGVEYKIGQTVTGTETVNLSPVFSVASYNYPEMEAWAGEAFDMTTLPTYYNGFAVTWTKTSDTMYTGTLEAREHYDLTNTVLTQELKLYNYTVDTDYNFDAITAMNAADAANVLPKTVKLTGAYNGTTREQEFALTWDTTAVAGLGSYELTATVAPVAGFVVNANVMAVVNVKNVQSKSFVFDFAPDGTTDGTSKLTAEQWASIPGFSGDHIQGGYGSNTLSDGSLNFLDIYKNSAAKLVYTLPVKGYITKIDIAYAGGSKDKFNLNVTANYADGTKDTSNSLQTNGNWVLVNGTATFKETKEMTNVTFTSSNTGKNLAIRSMTIYYVSFATENKMTFDANGGVADGTELTVKYGDTFTLPNATKAQSGKEVYNFKGWLCGEKTYQAGDTIMPEDNMTFVAQWETITLVTLNVVDGNNTTTNNYNEGTSYTLPAQAGVEGYQFVGWWNGTEFLANTTLTLTQDMTVTAVYANLEYIGASIKVTNGTGVRFGFALSLYNITDQTVLTNIAATITGKYVINTGKLNEIEVKSFRFGENGKLEMYFVMTNDFDAANNPTHAEYCGRELSVSLELNVNGNTVTANNANATYKTIASIATANATAEGASAELIAAAKKYGYVEA